jgi:hypothetical protein
MRLSEKDEAVIIDLGQMVDEQVYHLAMKYRGDNKTLSNAIRAVNRLMKDENEDELSIEASPEFKRLTDILVAGQPKNESINKEKQLTIKLLTEKLEKLTNKKVVLKEGK